MFNKKIVSVTAKFLTTGYVMPLIIHYSDDKDYFIDKVYSCKNCASLKVGGIGKRYEIRIGNKRTFLYLEDSIWFVEEKMEGNN